MRKILFLILGLLVIPLQVLVAQAPKIIAYQYWFDDNDAGMVSQSVSPATLLDLSASVNVPAFPVGFHRFSIRFQDDSLLYSPVSSSLFYYPVSTLINGYEYWFNNDYAGKTKVDVSNTTLLDLSSAIAASSLNPGMNTFHIRFHDVSGIYSATSSAYFVIVPEMLISGYEYWFDNDYGSKTGVNVANTQILDLSAVITATSLSLGFHAFHIRFKNTTGTWCSAQSDMFYKNGAGNQNNLTSYEYWFDDNSAGKVSVLLVNQPTADVAATINAGALQPGLHKAHVRFRNGDVSSVVSSSYFYKSGTANITENAISGYRFWFDNDPANMREIALEQPAGNLILLDSVELPYLPLGKHLMNVDFRDTLGTYSSIVSDSVDVQNCHPYAAKAITGLTQICKGTEGVVYSIPAITNATGYSWSLPEGATIVSGANTRAITVNYTLNAVSGLLSVSGTNPCGSGTDNSMLINLNPLPETVITPAGPTTLCQGETVSLVASGGTGYLWSTVSTNEAIMVSASGTYTVTATNIYGCSKTASQVVTVNPRPTALITPGGPTTFCLGGTVVLTASDGTGYRWSDGETTPVITVITSGTYSVTVTNTYGCIDIASRVVTVNPVPAPAIAGDTAVCSGAVGIAYTTESGKNGYSWTVTPGGNVTIGAGTNSIVVNWTTPGGSQAVTASYQNNFGCSGSKTLQVSVKPMPPSTRILESLVVPVGQTLCSDATDTLIVPGSGNSIQVQTGGSAILIAGKIIRILPGAKVAQGGYLHGYLSSDCFYCNAIPHTLPLAFKEGPVPGNTGTDTLQSTTSNFFRVYPNPTTGIFILESNSRDNLSGTIEIYGMRGERLISEQLPNGRKHEFSLQDKPNGMFIIRVVSKGVSGTCRIIKY